VKKVSKFQYSILIFSLALILTWGAAESFASPFFSSTSDPSYWKVATNVGGVDGAYSSFPTAGFTSAVAISDRTDWIANNSTGTNGGMETWTFFVFRQTFDLTGYDPTTADLQFKWAADDSGEGFASRGTWTPKFSLNGGSLINGTWATGNTYNLGPTAVLTSGFVSGLNTIDFYVEGNGVTDGFALELVSFRARESSAVPEPATMLLLGFGIVGLAGVRRFK
jgi:hypothetical protein